MKRNMGLPDRITRLVLATIAPILYAMDIVSGTFAIVLFLIADLLIGTSLFRFCPLYIPFGINTDKKIKH
jgi:hypothetical protein